MESGDDPNLAAMEETVTATANVPTLLIREITQLVEKDRDHVAHVFRSPLNAPKPYIRANRRGQAHRYRHDECRRFIPTCWSLDIEGPKCA